MLFSKIQLNKNLFHKSFFFDKYSITNIFQCPKITLLTVKLLSSSQSNLNKTKFCKLILLLQLFTGQQPRLLIQQCNIRNIQRKKVIGLFLTLHNYAYFFHFLTHRLCVFTASIRKLFIVSCKRAFTFEIFQKGYDDDILLQNLKITDMIKYEVTLKSNSTKSTYLRSLLITFKFNL
jgi:hypothetical protein